LQNIYNDPTIIMSVSNQLEKESHSRFYIFPECKEYYVNPKQMICDSNDNMEKIVEIEGEW